MENPCLEILIYCLVNETRLFLIRTISIHWVNEEGLVMGYRVLHGFNAYAVLLVLALLIMVSVGRVD